MGVDFTAQPCFVFQGTEMGCQFVIGNPTLFRSLKMVNPRVPFFSPVSRQQNATIRADENGCSAVETKSVLIAQP